MAREIDLTDDNGDGTCAFIVDRWFVLRDGAWEPTPADQVTPTGMWHDLAVGVAR
jgi:hypothetical protein